MTRRDFLKEYREYIDNIIRKAGYDGTINNEYRWQWVMNDEGLYNLAMFQGVKLT